MDEPDNNNPNLNDSISPEPDASWSLIKYGGIFAISLGIFMAIFGKDSFVSFSLVGGGLFLTAAVFWSGAKLFMTLVEAVGTDTKNGKELMSWYYNKYKPSPSRKANPTQEELLAFMQWKVEQEEKKNKKVKEAVSS